MTEAERFTPAEWQTLQFAVLWGFHAVAMADGKVDEKEVEAFTKELAEAPLYNGTLIREVLMSIAHDVGGTLSAYHDDSRKVDEGLREAADVLERKGDHTEAVLFKAGVIEVEKHVARASGSHFGDKMSKDEKQTIVMTGVLLRFDPEEFERIMPSYRRTA